MNGIKQIIKKFEIADSRAAFYYLSRYLKQAEYYEKYQKDIFEDDFQSTPSQLVKDITLCLIEFIEKQQNKKAKDFSNGEYIFWMEQIDEIESTLDPNPSSEQIRSAERIIESISSPPLSLTRE